MSHAEGDQRFIFSRQAPVPIAPWYWDAMSDPAESYKGYEDLAKAQDYRVQVRPNAGSSISVIAPHGGSIEQYTSDIARAIAGADFNLYLFEKVRRSGNYAALHLTSPRLTSRDVWNCWPSVTM